jgi:hypothetical protein
VATSLISKLSKPQRASNCSWSSEAGKVGRDCSYVLPRFNEQAKRYIASLAMGADSLPLRQRQDDLAIRRKIFPLRQIAPIIRRETIAFEYRHFQMSKPA